jgi:hypothetical protein
VQLFSTIPTNTISSTAEPCSGAVVKDLEVGVDVGGRKSPVRGISCELSIKNRGIKTPNNRTTPSKTEIAQYWFLLNIKISPFLLIEIFDEEYHLLKRSFIKDSMPS